MNGILLAILKSTLQYGIDIDLPINQLVSI